MDAFVVKTKKSKKNENKIMELPVKMTLKTSRFALLGGLRPPFGDSIDTKNYKKT